MHYVTLDDLDLLGWAKSDPKGFISSLGKSAIIDEIQRFPLLTVAIKYALDNENACFFMTGSSTMGLMDTTADTLAGRIKIISLPTACWGEELGKPVHSILDDKANLPQIRDAYRNLKKAVTYGQFPEVVSRHDEEEKQDILINYRNTYFTRDLRGLKQFEDRLNRPVKRILFYMGEKYDTVDDINFIPIGAIFRGK